MNPNIGLTAALLALSLLAVAGEGTALMLMGPPECTAVATVTLDNEVSVSTFPPSVHFSGSGGSVRCH